MTDIAELQQKVLEATEIHTDLSRIYYKKKFYEFNDKVLGWPDIYEPLHRKVCDFVANNVQNKKLLILLPRGCFKSSIVTVGYALWRIMQDPSSRGLIANATYPMAAGFLKQIKDYLQRNEKLRELYGDMSTNAPTWREDSMKVNHKKSYLSKEDTLTAMGLNSNYTGKHFDYAILDDLVNRDNIRTKDRIDSVVDFYQDVLDLVDINEYGNKEIIIIGTTWHFDDLYMRILDPKTGLGDQFEVLKMPAFEGDWGFGELLFPDRLGWKQLEDLRSQQDSSHFSAQYLLNPVPREQAVFQYDFRYFEKTDIEGLPLNKFFSVDPALTEKKESDYSAMVCVGVDKDNKWYILDIWQDKVNPKKLLDQMFYWDKIYKPIQVGIETTAFQRTLQFFAYEEMKKRNHFIPLKELKHVEMTKDERIRRLEPFYGSGTIFHNRDLKHLRDLEDQLRRYPKVANDDIIDALASVAEIAHPVRSRTRRILSRAKSRYPA